MPAFSYKEQFVPFIQDSTKCHTIRAFRKYPVQVGQDLSHFYGMRTAHCRRIIENTACTKVKTIFIIGNRDVWTADYMVKEAAEKTLKALQKGHAPVSLIRNWRLRLLDPREVAKLAWEDGFRPTVMDPKQSPDLVLNYETQCRELFLKFWSITHDLPFTGQLIKWDPVDVKPISITQN